MSAGLPSGATFVEHLILHGTQLYAVASAAASGQPWSLYVLDTSSGSPSFTALTHDLDSIAPGAAARHFSATSDTGFVTTESGLFAFALADNAPPARVGSGLPVSTLSLAIDEAASGDILYGTIFGSALEQLVISTDAGAHWQGITGTTDTGPLVGLAVGSQSHHLFSFASVVGGYEPVVSSDAGQSWQVISSTVATLGVPPAIAAESGAEICGTSSTAKFTAATNRE